MQRLSALEIVLRHVAESRSPLAVAEAEAIYERSGDAYVLGLVSFSQFICQRYESASVTAQQALAEATDIEAIMLARAVSGLAASGWTLDAAEDTLVAARADLDVLGSLKPDSAMFIRYLLAEAALDCARLRLAGEFLDASPELNPDFLSGSDGTHPYFTIMQVMVVRVLAFQGRITEAIERGEAAIEDSGEGMPRLLLDATMCLVHGNAAQKSTLRALAERVERSLPDPHDYLSSGGYLLVAFGLIATADVEGAARLVIRAGRTPGLESLTIIDRALGLEMLVAAAVAADDLDAARSWAQRAAPLAASSIGRPTVERMHSRVAMLAGDAAAAATWARRAIEHSQADDRAVETAEAEILLSRALIALEQRGVASIALETLASESASKGHLAARQSAARELRSIGRRLRPREGSGFAGLSERERDVALLIVEGFSNGAIASELHLSEHTVQVHVSRVLAAFGVASRFALAAQLANHIAVPDVTEPPPALTPRQNAVVDHLVLGLSNEQIAAALGVSVKTVEKHVSEIFRRWGVASRIGVSRVARSRPAD